MTQHIKNFDQYLNEERDYAGEHEAPGDDCAPLHDLTDTYPDDIYSSKALSLYGWNEDPDVDRESLNIIFACRNRPNKLVTVYRAVPDLDHERKAQLKEVRRILAYKEKYGFYPQRCEKIYALQDQFPVGEYTYNDQQARILQALQDEEAALSRSKAQKYPINSGDWVTFSRGYAKQHGINNLNGKYIIVSKKVKAKELFTDANDINEWGYVKSDEE